MSTVRSGILDAIFTALSGITDVGLVVDDGGVADSAIAEKLAAGTHVIEMVIGDDDPESVEQVLGKESYGFDVAAVIHLAPAKHEPATANVKPYQLAATLYARAYTALMGSDGNGEDWGGLAMKTEMLGGGGVAFDQILGTRQTVAAARV